MSTIQAIILAIIEGLTEFLPISSTGHMVLMSSYLGIENDKFTKLFEVCIQLGAILAVVVLYWKKFFDFSKWQFYVKLALAVVPALIFGKLFDDLIDEHLGSPVFIASVLLVGGIILLFVDNWFKNPIITEEVDINNITAIKIGMYQCLAIMFPGLSRSAATILGGMQQKLSRGLAAEFSFFLAVPTMAAATGYKLLKFISEEGSISEEQVKLLGIGNLVAFIVAVLAIKFFITVLNKYGFKYFGIYRIIVGIVILVLAATGSH
ncbi:MULTISPECIES: undecaprenyl-diphosphate phosphatase [unclassified Arcicella]|uniref:undecaprenyl-diphosphate phosphatase n=1 Tax=unclassified Arcicella TaxID=2644986 RepID=UPI0028612F63|nr:MULTISPECIES: undecaprenyl-diphosphate phosphatase [unclassified Arcicella]MDR6562656.1 undecaprenyl-diphosphatase [Arcicella sp. BE51]MDR6812743.1 undecaprenyl-diphosphatase [Arcicella sp. BE140]MDR6824055.1 undecaprenyl-diphosphatase [Arcicella sp. BE139]